MRDLTRLGVWCGDCDEASTGDAGGIDEISDIDQISDFGDIGEPDGGTLERDLLRLVGAFGIKGMGAEAVRALVRGELVSRPADVFDLGVEKLLDLPPRVSMRRPFAEKSAENLLAQIEASKSARLDRFLFALGIPNVGAHVARVLAARFGSVEEVRKATPERLREVHEIGEEVADSVVSFFENETNIGFLETLLNEHEGGVAPRWEETGSSTLTGMRVVLTGTLPGMSREEATALIERHGGRVVSSVSRKTTLVVAGDNPGSKRAKAEELGVPVGDESLLRGLADGTRTLPGSEC